MAPTPTERLRAFEDEKLGADAPRHDGQVEKGHGSLFRSKLSPEDKHLHSLMEQAIDAESDVADARASLLEAEQAAAEIEKKIAAASEPKEPDEPPLPPFKPADEPKPAKAD